MAEIKIDGKSYDTEKLSQEARNQVNNLQFVDQEIARTRAHLAVLQTARQTYAQGLKEQLEKQTD